MALQLRVTSNTKPGFKQYRPTHSVNYEILFDRKKNHNKKNRNSWNENNLPDLYSVTFVSLTNIPPLRWHYIDTFSQKFTCLLGMYQTFINKQQTRLYVHIMPQCHIPK